MLLCQAGLVFRRVGVVSGRVGAVSCRFRVVFWPLWGISRVLRVFSGRLRALSWPVRLLLCQVRGLSYGLRVVSCDLRAASGRVGLPPGGQGVESTGGRLLCCKARLALSRLSLRTRGRLAATGGASGGTSGRIRRRLDEARTLTPVVGLQWLVLRRRLDLRSEERQAMIDRLLEIEVPLVQLEVVRDANGAVEVEPAGWRPVRRAVGDVQ